MEEEGNTKVTQTDSFLPIHTAQAFFRSLQCGLWGLSIWISDSSEVSFGGVSSAHCIPLLDDSFPFRALTLAFSSPREPPIILIFRSTNYVREVFCNFPCCVSDLLKLCASRLIEFTLARVAMNEDSKVCVLA